MRLKGLGGVRRGVGEDNVGCASWIGVVGAVVGAVEWRNERWLEQKYGASRAAAIMEEQERAVW